MSEAPTPDRDEEMLARLAEFDLAAAERVHGRLMAAEAASEIAELGRTYQRIARSLRQTLALKAKLKRDRETAAKEAPARRPGGVAVARRIGELQTAVRRVIWSEAERLEEPDFAQFLEQGLEEGIRDELWTDSFCDETLDDHIARYCLVLGLPSEDAERWRDLPDPPDDEPDEDDEPGDSPDRMGSG
jgi:hypothetical protein